MDLKNSNFSTAQKRFFRGIIVCAIVCLLLECFWFNIRFWESIGYKQSVPSKITYDKEEKTVDLSGFDLHIDNIYMDVFSNIDDEQVIFAIKATDDTDTVGFWLASTNTLRDIPESRYVRLHLIGTTDHLIIKFDRDIDYESARFVFNTPRPFNFVPSRVALIFAICAVIILFWSGILKVRLDIKDKTHMMIIIMAGIFLFGAWMKIAESSYYTEAVFKEYDRINYVEQIYNYLARALLKGQVHLDVKPPSYLSGMTNPYIRAERDILTLQTGEMDHMDYAYFDGRYYCYYGLIPALFFYVPYVALTGQLVYSYWVVLVCAAVFIPSSFAFIYRLIRKFRGEVSLDTYLLLSLLFINCCGFLTYVKRPVVYSVPYAMSYCLIVLGLYFWLTACDKEKMSVVKLILGAVMIAMTLGTRPVFMITLLLAFPIFADRIKKGDFFRLKAASIVNTSAVIVPFLVIDIPLLFYNKARFGSFLDFGSKYNLTRDLLDDRFILERIPGGIYTYFFQPMNINASYPFIHAINDKNIFPTDYQGAVYNELFAGGLFFVIPFCIALFFIPLVIGSMKKNRSRFIVFTLIGISIFLALVDIEFAGIANRYLTDFSIFMLIASVIVVLSVRNKDTVRLRKAFFVICLLTIFLAYFLLLSDGRSLTMRYNMPNGFGYFKYLFFDLR